MPCIYTEYPSPEAKAMCEYAYGIMQHQRPTTEVELDRWLAEQGALQRSFTQRGQLALGCNDVIDTVWGTRIDREGV